MNDLRVDKNSGSVYVDTQEIDIHGKKQDYDFVFTEQKLIRIMRVLRTDFGINTIEELNEIDKENVIAHIHLFDLLLDVIVDDKKMNSVLKTGLDLTGVANFFKLFAKDLKMLSNKIEKKNAVQKGGHRSTNGNKQRR